MQYSYHSLVELVTVLHRLYCVAASEVMVVLSVSLQVQHI